MHDNQALYTSVTPRSNEFEIIVMPLGTKAFLRAEVLLRTFSYMDPQLMCSFFTDKMIYRTSLLHLSNICMKFIESLEFSRSALCNKPNCYRPS